MSLRDKLNDDMKKALKEQDKMRLSVLRMVKASIKNQEIDKKRELSEDEVLEVLAKEVKLRKEAAVEFAKGGRDEAVANIEQEVAILNEYLPTQLTEEEIRHIVREAIQQTGAVGKNDLGMVMKAVMPRVKGRADGKLVNSIVNEFLAK